MAGEFVPTKGSIGMYHLTVHASNGQVIATSQTYESQSAALNGIDSVKPCFGAGPLAEQVPGIGVGQVAAA